MKYFIIESDLFQEQFEGGYFFNERKRKFNTGTAEPAAELCYGNFP